jgi:transcriptional regulator
MGKVPLDLLQGTLDLLVLRTLTWGPMHGYGVTTAIRDRTDGEIEVVDAALYKALHRLERDGLIDATWSVSDNNRKAKFYALSPAGRAHLKAELVQWRRYSAAMEKIIKPA